MEHLAVVQATSGATLRGMLDLLARTSTGGGALVACVAEVQDDEITAITKLGSRFGSVTIVRIHRSAWDPAHAAPATIPTYPVVLVSSVTPFADTWNRTVATRGRRGAVLGAVT